MAYWDLVYEKRPKTTNWERTQHHRVRSKFVKEWREAGLALAEEQNLPKGLTAIGTEVMAIVGTRHYQDNAACLPSYKAFLDGLVDYGLIEDDGREQVPWTIFHACEYVKGYDALWLRVHDLGANRKTFNSGRLRIGW